MTYPGFCGGAYQSQSPLAAQERTVNFIPERLETPYGKAEWALYPSPGVSSFGTVPGQSPVRALFEENGRCFAVVGAAFVEFDSTGTPTTHGTVATDPQMSPATITSNGDGGNQLFLTASGEGYVFDLATNTLTVVLPANAATCDAIDGYIVVLDDSDSTLMASPLFDATSFPALRHEQRASLPDPWLTLKVHRQLIYLPGERSTDIYYNAGLANFPFALHTAGAIPYGIAAVDSMAVVGDALMWLARSADGIGQVIQVSGSSAREVSTHALRVAIRGYRDTVGISDAQADSYEEDGHTFYVLTFPAADATWVFDLTTGLWTERLTWVAAEGRWAAWRPLWHCVAFGKHLIGDRLAGTVYQLGTQFANDANGDPIRRLRRPPILFQDNKRFRVNAFELILEPGLGLTTGQGSDPQVMLNLSRDGQTWRALPNESAGRLGEYDTRVEWTRLGIGRHFIPEIVVSDPIPWRLLGATVTLGPSAGT